MCRVSSSESDGEGRRRRKRRGSAQADGSEEEGGSEEEEDGSSGSDEQGGSEDEQGSDAESDASLASGELQGELALHACWHHDSLPACRQVGSTAVLPGLEAVLSCCHHLAEACYQQGIFAVRKAVIADQGVQPYLNAAAPLLPCPCPPPCPAEDLGGEIEDVELSEGTRAAMAASR